LNADPNDTTDSLSWLPARELARRLIERRTSSVEVLETLMERIEKHNPVLNAIVSLDPDRALERAEAADASLGRGEIWGPLHGVPMTIKDGYDVAGMRTTVGTDVLDRVPAEDGTVVARLRQAGAIVIGHSNVPPWLADYQTANPIFGRTANPWDLDRTPGGSSGGAVAALAAGLAPLEVGSDLAGSCRLPPHFCGVYGLKTTEHRVPDTGFFRPLEEVPRSVRILGATGPLARDLDDLELALKIISGPDGRDGDVPPVPLVAEPRRPLADLRLAAVPTLPGAAVAGAMQEQVERVAAAVADEGAAVEARLPETDWEDLYQLYGHLMMTVTGLFDPAAELPDEHRSLAWYLAALDRRDRFVAVWEMFFSDVDALIMPPALTTAFTHRQSSAPLDVDGTEVEYEASGAPLVIFNLTGQPALVAPAGLDHQGLPIGIQIVGPRWSEMRLLAIARALEEAGILPGFRPPPGY
jgi:amidase